ncbi:archaeosortase/exosortase family protein [Promicromonospora sp. NPDC050262]|uniref:archaeosortase/exosortase family protein n=1 Tax=Promicromonospora sp. NPDC050262 TaxID=3155036 RepID=UPI0033CC8135
MTAPPIPAVADGGSPAAAPPPARRRTALRVLAALPVAAAGVATILVMDLFRHGEALLTAWSLENLLGRAAKVFPAEDVFYYQAARGAIPVWGGFTITEECSAAWFVGGVLLVTALLLAVWRRAGAGRLLVAGSVTVVLLVVVNTARMVLITEATVHWGESGFGWSHTVGGSILMIATLCLCALLFARIALLSRTRRTRAEHP